MQDINAKDFAPFIHLDNVLLFFIREYFKYHPKYPWNEDDSISKIGIVKKYTKIGNEFALPRVVIKRNGFDLTHPFQVSNQMSTNEDGSPRTLMQFTQNRKKLYIAGAPYTIEVIALTESETEAIAEEICIALLTYRENINVRFQIKIEDHLQVSPTVVNVSGTKVDNCFCTITTLASYQYSINYTLQPKYPILKGLDLLQNVEKNVEVHGKLDFEKLKFNSQIKGE